MRIKKLLSAVLVAAITFTGVNVGLITNTQDVKAASTIEYTLPVNVIDSIDTTEFTSQLYSFDWAETEDRVDTVYKLNFTVDSLEYVHININSSVSYEGYSNLGVVDEITLYAQNGMAIDVISTSCNILSTIDKYYVLEKGSYYILLNGLEEKDSYGKTSTGKVTTLIEAEKVSRTGNVTGQKKNPIKLSDKKTSFGYISNTTADQYFMLEVKNESKIKFNFYTTNTPSCFSKNINYRLYSETGKDYSNEIEIKTKEPYSHTQCSLGEGFFYKMPDVGTATVTLPKGIYYFQFTAKEARKDATQIAVGINVSPLTKAISKLSVTAKKNTKKVVVKTISKASVKVKIGKKTYNVKTNSKGAVTVKTSKLKKGTKVKVTVIKTGYKTKSKTVKVK